MNIESYFKISYGLYIVSSKDGERLNGHISNTVFQVTADPPQIAICSNKNNLTTDFIISSNVFAVTIIQQEVDLNFIGHFGFKSGKEFNKFETMPYKLGVTGAPIVLEKSIAYFECVVTQTVDVGSHILFIGKVVECDLLNNPAQPLTYNYYRNVIKGISPKNSPTYIDRDKLEALKKEKDSNSPKYICNVCGYVYDPDIGDPSLNIKPGTLFEDLPENYVCPICSATKDLFSKQ